MTWDISLETQPPEFGKRANPSEQYEVPVVSYSPRELILLKALKKAVSNGWQGWRGFVNDAVTLGMEPEGVLRDMRRAQAPIEPLIFNIEFVKSLWPDDWYNRIQDMAVDDERIKYIANSLS